MGRGGQHGRGSTEGWPRSSTSSFPTLAITAGHVTSSQYALPSIAPRSLGRPPYALNPTKTNGFSFKNRLRLKHHTNLATMNIFSKKDWASKMFGRIILPQKRGQRCKSTHVLNNNLENWDGVNPKGLTRQKKTFDKSKDTL